MGKLYDLAVKTRTYKDKDGNDKAVWKNIGSVLETKDGGQVMLLDRTFNPAGIDVEPGRDSIMVSMFEPRTTNEGQMSGQQRQAPAQRQAAPAGNAGGFNDMDSDLPF